MKNVRFLKYKTILYFSSSTVFSVKQWEHNQIRYTIRKIELQQMFVGPVFLFNDCVEEKWIPHNLTSFISLQIESTWALHRKKYFMLLTFIFPT